MTDENVDLRSELEKLRQEIDQLAGNQPKVRAHFESVAAQIEGLLDKKADEGSESDAEEESSIIERLSETARNFEEEHPTLSEVVGRMVDGLGQMGI